jgi:hypothetical protein
MSLRRFAARRDANEAQIRQCLGAMGWLTQPLSIKDWPDLLCARGGRLVLLEIKAQRPTSEGGRHGVSKGQSDVHELLTRFGIVVIVARSAEEFLEAVDPVTAENIVKIDTEAFRKSGWRAI